MKETIQDLSLFSHAKQEMPSRGYVKLSNFSNKTLTTVILPLQLRILFHTSHWKLSYSTKNASN